MHLACTESQNTFINNCWSTNGPNGAVAYVNGLRFDPKQYVYEVCLSLTGFGETGLTWKKSHLLLERKKINHEISLNRWYNKWFTSWWYSTRHGQQISGSVFLHLLHLDSDAHNVFLSILSKARNIWSKKGFLSQYEDLMFPLVLVSTFF